MRTCKRIISLFGIFAIVCSFLPFYAYAEEYVAPTGFGTWLMSQSDNSLYRTLMKYVTLGTGCDQNADGRHRANVTADGFVGTLVNDASSEYMGYYYCCCKDCGQYFLAAPSEVNSAINNAYNNYVQELPANQVDSSGNCILIIDGWHYDTDKFDYIDMVDFDSSLPSFRSYHTNAGGADCSCKENEFILYSREFSVPVDGKYELYVPSMEAIGGSRTGGCVWREEYVNDDWLQYSQISLTRYSSDAEHSGIWNIAINSAISGDWNASNKYRLCLIPQCDLYPSDSRICPCFLGLKNYGHFYIRLGQSYASAPQYSVDYRPTSISAPVYYTDNSGQVNVTTGDVHLFSENDMTLTNPQTGTTSTVTDWSYDYSSRTYDLTLDTGEHSTVTYGDENITIKEGDTTYIYNYYISPNYDPGNNNDPGDTDKPEEPADDDHRHDWVLNEASTIWHDAEGNQIPPEFVEYTCSKCGLICRCHDGESPPEFGCGGGGSGGGLIDPGTGELIPTGDTETGLALIGDKLLSLWNSLSESFGQLPQFYAAAVPIIPPEILQLMEWAVVVGLLVGVWRLFKR